ncbi:Na+/H+ antiporter subunit E [Mycobacterium colombiense]|uniref:Na+/H+ antiporter subunit E n=1 Tax=Mycobacterium colombiense TaxID=339268 RepID=UPI0020A56D3F|nr:Na+/H+ antiporter subunit E [Mycobacterium colombiense]
MGIAMRARPTLALAVWAFLVWILLSWTATVENVLVGAVVALGCGFAFAPLGEVVGPWTALRPRRLVALGMLGASCAARIVVANLSLTRRILSPSRPLHSGMVIVSTKARSDGELAATGLLTSLVVDNQFVDLDRDRRQLQYHAMAVPDGPARESVNAPLERRVIAVARSRERRSQ